MLIIPLLNHFTYCPSLLISVESFEIHLKYPCWSVGAVLFAFCQFSMVDINQHTGMVSFVVEGCLKFDLSTVTPKKKTNKQTNKTKQNKNTPKKLLAEDLFTHVSSKSIELCRRRKFNHILLQMTPSWPLTPTDGHCIHESQKSIQSYIRRSTF